MLLTSQTYIEDVDVGGVSKGGNTDGTGQA